MCGVRPIQRNVSWRKALFRTNVPFEVLGVVVIAWTIALLQMYSIDNVNFEMFEIQKGSQSIEEAVEEGEFEN